MVSENKLEGNGEQPYVEYGVLRMPPICFKSNKIKQDYGQDKSNHKIPFLFLLFHIIGGNTIKKEFPKRQAPITWRLPF